MPKSFFYLHATKKLEQVGKKKKTDAKYNTIEEGK